MTIKKEASDAAESGLMKRDYWIREFLKEVNLGCQIAGVADWQKEVIILRARLAFEKHELQDAALKKRLAEDKKKMKEWSKRLDRIYHIDVNEIHEVLNPVISELDASQGESE